MKMDAFDERPANRRWRFLPHLAAIAAWTGVTLQLYLSVHRAWSSGRGIVSGLISYFGYFSILTNILVALALTFPLLLPRTRLGRLFQRPGVNTVTAASIIVVALAYTLLLRHTRDPQGLALVVDTLLHDVTPALFVCYWWLCVPKHALHWRQLAAWLAYPLGYLVYVMLRGEWLGRYPYYFIDVNTLGYTRSLMNAFGILLGYVLIACFLIAIARVQARRVAARRRE